jgi:hypothetical protein
VEPLVERRRNEIENATANLVKAYAEPTAHAMRQDAETDVIVMKAHPTRTALLLATPMTKVAFARHHLWELLRLHRLPRRLLSPMMNKAPLVAGALAAEIEEIETKIVIVNVSAVAIVAGTGSTVTVAALEAIASADVPIPKKMLVMEMPGVRGWEMITNALVEERDMPQWTCYSGG